MKKLSGLLILLGLCIIVGCSQEPVECPQCPECPPVEEKVEMTFFDRELFMDRMFKTDPEEPYGYDDEVIIGTFIDEGTSIYNFYPNGEMMELYQSSGLPRVSNISICKYIYRDGVLTFDYGNNVKHEWQVRFEDGDDTLILSREESLGIHEMRFERRAWMIPEQLEESTLEKTE